MQILDMKALKSLHAHHKYLSNPISKNPPKCLSIVSRHFHPTPSRFRCAAEPSGAVSEPEPDEASSAKNGPGPGRRVWSIYDPVTGGVVTQWGAKEKTERESEKPPKFSSFYDEIEDLERKRTYGSAKTGSPGDGEKTQMGFSSFNKEIDDLTERQSYGRVKEETLSDDSGKKKNSGEGGGKPRMGLPRYSGKNENSTNEGGYRSVKTANSRNGLVETGDVVGYRKKGKSKTSWVCESCGFATGQWWGSCRSCNAIGTMKQFSEVSVASGSKVSGIEVSENVMRSWMPHQAGGLLRLPEVQRGMDQLAWRIALSGPFGSEVARVLGGGLVPGSLVLVGGDPGVGKSTLLLQMAATIAEQQDLGKPAAAIAEQQDLGKPAPVVYVSGEESIEQIGNRADRLKIGTEEIFLYSSTDIEDILGKIQPLFPSAVIIDSIQTVYLKGVTGSAGGVQQVKECTSALLRFAKRTNIPVLLIGHVNKDGDIAGPRVLEHIVDVVLYMEGEKYSTHRLLRPVKNRFGSTDELGVFEMSHSGLQAVSNPSEIFLSEQHTDSQVLAGLAVAVIMDGSRSFLIEVQALCTSATSVSRHCNGIQASRADMIISVLMKQAGLMLRENSIYINVVSGVSLKETAGDVAVAAAICSSFLEFPIPNDIAFIGEIGLSGELRMVPRIEKRVTTVAKLGYKTCIVPASAEKYLANLGFEGMKIVGCKNLKEVINNVFRAR
ncbi:hypothetical protein Tsubulata_013225 [Turnera subulata]|uniref:RecA family profile 1 domain-containing protein n=1 Tax=Turnera subulata TaxID=218843 RepID=A0A9Q0FKR6_9ROSI|nr:hypothetical protein Tsubulata_013225 [Turnera subulata]